MSDGFHFLMVVLERAVFVDFALLLAARTMLRAYPPLRAHRLLTRVGRWLPTIKTPEEARRVSWSLRRYGNCLSRSLAVAARAPTADVAIGVAPAGRSPLLAHAWIEMGGVPIDPSDVAGAVIARIPGRQSSR